MRTYYRILGFVLFLGLFTACTKTDQEVIDLLKDIKAQNDALKAQVTALQKTSDSLALALKGTNQTLGNMDKKIDSVRNQLVVVLSQLNVLNAQMAQANVNIADIQAKIVVLQAKCTELYNLLYSFINGGTNPDIQNGLVGLYFFSGNTLDSSGNGNHGQPNNVSLTSDRFGRSNRAYFFNGTDAFVDIPNKLFDNGWNEYSISLWFKKSAIQLGSGPGNTFINTNPHTGIDIGYDYQGSQKIYLWKNSNPSFQGWDIFSNVSFNNNPVASGVWYSVIVVKSGNSYSLYVNGLLDKQLVAPILPVSYLCSMRIGGITTTSSGGFVPEGFTGSLDDIRIYNRALGIEEVKTLSAN